MVNYELRKGHATKKEGSPTLFFPLINRHGKVQEFPENVAKDILRNVADLGEKVPHPSNPKSPANNKVVDDHKGTTKWFLDGWRPLKDSEFTQWNEDGHPSILSESRVNAPEQIDPSVIASKDAEIEALKAQLAQVTRPSMEKPTPKKQPEAVGKEGGAQ